jgi:hypothetical protein
LSQTVSVTQELANWAYYAQIAATFVAAFGLICLAIQICFQQRNQREQVLTRLFDEMITPSFQEKLRFIYSRLPENLVLAKLDVDQRAVVDEVTARFEALGFKVRKRIIPKRDTVEIFWDWVIRCAQQLRPHIQDQRRRRGPSDNYREDFDWLARECKLYQLKRLGHKGSTTDMTLD